MLASFQSISAGARLYLKYIVFDMADFDTGVLSSWSVC